MKIALIAPLIESVPPQLYGGTERIVSYLADELTIQGHDVTLFASADSKTLAKLVPCCAKALRLTPSVVDPIPYYMAMLDRVKRSALQFDVLHFHIDQFHFPIFSETPLHTLTTLHGRQDLPDLQYLYSAFPQMPLVGISKAQQAPIPKANVTDTVLHGIPRDLLRPGVNGSAGYLAFLGRISPEKRVDRAIAIAEAVQLPLKIAAKIDRSDQEYFKQIQSLFQKPGVEYIGEIDERQKESFLGNASALLFPIDWPEPFGLVMIEAMACGTPVIGFRHGSVAEVIDPGVTGAIVDSVDEAVRVLPSVLGYDRNEIRQRFEMRFTADRMASDYVKIYHRLQGRAAMAGIELTTTSNRFNTRDAKSIRLETELATNGSIV